MFFRQWEEFAEFEYVFSSPISIKWDFLKIRGSINLKLSYTWEHIGKPLC